jgi:ABC-2 type transport system ATP-binding protein
MRQKLGIGMALLSKPPMVVLDEPTTGLDPVSRSEIWTLIGSSAAEGTALLITTTYVDEAARGTSVLALDEGAMLAHGSIGEVKASMSGSIAESGLRPSEGVSWRRGQTWRTWRPDGSADALTIVDPDLSDLLIVAALRRRQESHA